MGFARVESLEKVAGDSRPQFPAVRQREGRDRWPPLGAALSSLLLELLPWEDMGPKATKLIKKVPCRQRS